MNDSAASTVNRWDRETDLLVVGAGPAGMTAALVASLEGLDVVLCEKSQQVGGTGATSAGTLWIPENRPSTDAGFGDTRAAAARYLDALIGDRGDADIRRTFLEDGPAVIDYLMEKTEVQFVPCGRHPDYRNNLPGSAVEGRAIIPVNFDGRRLGADFERVRPPIDDFMVMGGMMVGKVDIDRLVNRYKSAGAFFHSASIVLRYLIDRLGHKRGTRLVMGNALVARLFYSLRQRGVPILFGRPLGELIRDGDRVIGAILNSDGAPQRIRARRGVVLATGGIAHNADYRSRFMPSPTPPHSLAASDNQGDGLRIAEAVGARLEADGNESGGLWSPVSVTRHKDGSTGLFPHLSLDRAKPGLIAVNSAGRRFVNEGLSYHDFVEAMYRSHETVPTMPAWLVCDAAFVKKYGIGVIYPGTTDLRPHAESGYATVAETLDGLARALGIDADGLRDTVDRHNRFAAEGSDPDFGKGDLELNRFNGDPEAGPNPCLGPIGTPPFVAVAVWPAEIACSIGLSTTASAEVVNGDGQSIPGLYACGNDMASVMAGTYPGPGTTLGPGMVFGYRAAMHAAAARRAAN